GIAGYGNLGKGVESAINYNPDMELVAVFSRRDPKDLKLDTLGVEAVHISQIGDYRDKIDVMMLCGGSATDLPEQGPYLAEMFNTVDRYDNHGRIPEYFANMNKAAKKRIKVALISIGWDPGLF